MAFFKRRKKKKKKKDSELSESAKASSETREAAGEDSEPNPEIPPDREQAVQALAVPDPAAKTRQDAAPEAIPPSPETKAAADQPPETETKALPADEEAPSPAEPDNDAVPGDQAESERKGLLGRLKKRLGKTREKISGSIDRMTFGKQIDEDTLDELEEVLVTADLGVATAMELIDGLRGQVRRRELADAEALKKALQQSIGKLLAKASSETVDRTTNNPHVIMVVGVNGVGKTTTIGKLAHRFTNDGRKVMLAAGDTFRAAAAEQLTIWSDRTGAPIVRQQHGADPSAVAYDAVDAAINRGRDLLLIDTAGRLQTKVNLMEELKKIHRVVGKRLEGAPHEVLLVLDATTGQNALSQAKLFNEAVNVSGVVLTKLDGTAKGGIVVAIASELKLPIRYVGLGEGIEDLRPFDPGDFAKAIF